MEKMKANIQPSTPSQSKPTSGSTGSVIWNHTLISTSGTKENPTIVTPSQPPPQKIDESLFSLPKVKLPTCNGIDARGWVSKDELYFQVHKTPTNQKLGLSQMCMDESVLHWFTNLLIRHPDTTWEQFRLKLLNIFSGTKYCKANEALGSLFQECNVEEYIVDFEALSALIPDQSEVQSVGWFLRGLQIEIRNCVRTLSPSTCDQAMEYFPERRSSTRRTTGET